MEQAVNYIGEHLCVGRLGFGLIFLAFITVLLSAFSYFMSTSKRTMTEDSAKWKSLGSSAFVIHAFSIFSIFGLILFMMFSQMYEYNYVWAHVNGDVPKKFIFAAFWEGQEGSFLLWMFWHAILGLVLMRAKNNWNARTLPWLALVQALLLSMIFGIYLPGTAVKIGSSPFSLLREVMNAPIFSQPDYLSKITGNGLNVLLQNYWMTIHPPTLFLGFAACTIPFCFAMGALQSGKHREWLKVVQPWALFAGGILGTGVLMGAAWAYEALSFNGYWAWDPVENMSLVPWLILLAGIHTNLIARSTGRSIKSTYWFYISSFLLVLYSTFLTRSGILGDSSAHAFTEMGLEWQLIIFLGAFTLLSFWNYFTHNKSIPKQEQEEAIVSREFWMFIGSIVLLFSSLLITFTTSIPVYNKIITGIGSLMHTDLTSWHRATPLDPIGHYNKFQLWTTIFMALITGFAYFLRYKQMQLSPKLKRDFYKQVGLALGLAAAATVATSLIIQLPSWQHYLLAFAGWFAFTGNAIYFFNFLRTKPLHAGSSLSHMGFGLMIIGIIASGLNKQFISTNPFTQRGLLHDEDLGKNILIFKHVPAIMNGYEVTYSKDTLVKNDRTFYVDFAKLDDKGNKTGEVFTLKPNIVYDRAITKIAAVNPSTKRTLTKDLYTHIASLAPEEADFEQAKAKEDSMKYISYQLVPGETQKSEKFEYTISNLDLKPKIRDYKHEPGDLAISVHLKVKNLLRDTVYEANPAIVLRKESVINFPDQINDLSVKTVLSSDIFSHMFENASRSSKSYNMKPGDSIEMNGQIITFEGYEKIPVKNDKISIGAIFKNSKGETIGTPIMEINGNQVLSPKVYLENAGTIVAFTHLDPQTEKATFEFNLMFVRGMAVPLKIAENSLRSDYIVLEAVIFPGINFFWSGSLMMMLGLLLSMYNKIRLRRAE